MENTNVKKLAKEIISGRRLNRQDDLSFLLTADLDELCEASDNIRKELCGNQVNLCVVINGRQGGCSENCKFCSQSAHNHSGIEVKPFQDVDVIVEDCKRYYEKGVHKYSIVTAGKGLSKKDMDKACAAYDKIHEECPGLGICASHGILKEEDFLRLKEHWVDMYHENIETSKRYFPNICTSHTYEDKLKTIALAKKAGLSICCGGILGMGETWEDRIDMAVSIAEIGVDSIPLNALMPIPGTPFGKMNTLSEAEILRCTCIFRFLNPTAAIRLAAGRVLMKDSGRKAFLSGANATLTGDMLTTSGNNINEDIKMLSEMEFDL